ncbi:ThiF family adenylyltransferase [Saccharothrix obliqua]|uniref:ThiF family adenylyltransferase n=1 Tax=Saccharothrix obliqua TaxID=2861747 RepID=UPI0027E249A2|nr:ThiF family adenylyltransferase [Saccharothrix obliqua]
MKHEHRPFLLGANEVRIGGRVPGIASVVHDPDGWVWALLAALDGTHTTEQVISDMARRFPDHAAADVRTALDELDAQGHLEDAAEPPPTDLSPSEQDRYSRGRALWRWMSRTPGAGSWAAQSALRSARVVVVGVGGVGSTAALALVASGVGQVHLVEPDVVELSNLNRQLIYTERDLGRHKAVAAVRRLRAHNREVRVTGERTAVDGPDVLRRLAAKCDVLLMAADTPSQIRSWTNRACRDTGTAWVHGGYHGPQVNVGVFRPGTGPCYDCARRANQEHIESLPITPWPGGIGSTAVNAANAVSSGIAGHLAAHAAMSLVTGVPALPVNREYGFNLVTLLDNVALGVEGPRADCPTCGRGVV